MASNLGIRRKFAKRLKKKHLKNEEFITHIAAVSKNKQYICIAKGPTSSSVLRQAEIIIQTKQLSKLFSEYVRNIVVL